MYLKALSKAVDQKHHLYNKYLHSMSPHDFQIYAKQRNVVKSKIRSAQRNYEEQLINKFNVNSKAFYSYVKSKQKIKASIPHLKVNGNSTTSNNLETAEVLNSFFQSTFTHENTDKIPAFLSRSDACITDIIVTKDMVFEKISKLKPFKAPGPDEIHPYTVPLRNVHTVYVSHFVCCTINHSNLVSYCKTGSVLILFLFSKREKNPKLLITGQ